MKAIISIWTSWLLRVTPLWLAALLAGCSTTTRQSTLDPKGPIASLQFDLFMVTVWVTLFIFITVGGALLWVVFRFRERKKDESNPLPDLDHGNPLIEIGLIIVSVLLLIIIAVPTLQGVFYTHDLPNTPSSKLGNWYTGDLSKEEHDNVLEVNVTGYQWWWQFEYPQLGVITANEMAIPISKVIKINLRAHDVIHSFWLPKIAGKVDLIPGRANWMWIQGDETGYYYGQCAEFCGSAHAYMLFRAEVLSTEDFEKWVTHQKQESVTSKDKLVLEGKELFTSKTCIQCHTIEGNSAARGVKGPSLTHVATRKSLGAGILDNMDIHGNIDPVRQHDNMMNWILHSNELKPGNLMYNDIGGLKDVHLTDEDVRKIVAYLQTLK